jgi:type III secretory pathway component EscT
VKEISINASILFSAEIVFWGWLKSEGSAINNKLSLVGMQLPEKYKDKMLAQASSAGIS